MGRKLRLVQDQVDRQAGSSGEEDEDGDVSGLIDDDDLEMEEEEDDDDDDSDSDFEGSDGEVETPTSEELAEMRTELDDLAATAPRGTPAAGAARSSRRGGETSAFRDESLQVSISAPSLSISADSSHVVGVCRAAIRRPSLPSRPAPGRIG